MKTLYRGQTKDHGIVLASGWRKLWKARAVLITELLPLADRCLKGTLEQAAFEAELSKIAATAEQAPSLHRFLQEETGRRLVGDLICQIRDSFSADWRLRIFRAQLGEMEAAFFLRYQSYLFNETQDQFLERIVPATMHHLAQLLLEFYDSHRDAFDVEYRIAQVTTDFMGLLQHYGVVGTPGLDLTDDLEVALWFATHWYNSEAKRYDSLPPESWGCVYEARIPVVVWVECGDARAAHQIPDFTAVNLASLSPLFVRVARQHGYYAVHALGWERIIDYREVVQITKRDARDYGAPQAIEERLAAKGLSEVSLFPSTQEDSFKAHLASQGIETFL